MLGHRSDLRIEAVPCGEPPHFGETGGFWLVTYTADGQAVRTIDWDRHLWLQRPRHTVSVAMIVGPGAEETLHWSLRSVAQLADEVIVADCGMSQEARRIAHQYELRIVSGIDPKLEGFEHARNLALDSCTKDFCLWIDSDEKLVGARHLAKYLRDNGYHGYSLRQHHFSCDAASLRDYPVRLFRRRPHGGRTIRFWGAIHEHPELSLNHGPGPTITIDDVHVAHVGHLDEEIRRQRFIRNWPLLQLDQQRYPERILQKFFVMRDNVHPIRYALAASRGRVDESMRARCRDTVRLYREHFLGKGGKLSRDALEYYSEALTVLGEGFEAAFQVESDKACAKPNGVSRYRFASSDDLRLELEQLAREKAAQFDCEWW
jgi:glycosyltransferase involved in cell wall biosynthesis